jgi:hypothetical protein
MPPVAKTLRVPWSGDPHAWGGPRIQWADQRDHEVMVFALDDEVEAEEWRILYTQVEALVRS